MAVTNYHTVNGRILGETTSGARTDYVPDALGSVRGTTNGSTFGNSYRFAAYGSLLLKTGSDPDPRFGWVGTLGYRRTTMPYADQYVRASHYGSGEGRWTSVDPLWPMEPAFPMAPPGPNISGFRPRSYSPGIARWLTRVRMEEMLAGEQPYGYAMANPTTHTDPQGLQPGRPGKGEWVEQCCRQLKPGDYGWPGVFCLTLGLPLHCWLQTSSKDPNCQSIGYGPGGILHHGGNLGAGDPGDINCKRRYITPNQLKCLCDGSKHLAQGWIMFGSTWCDTGCRNPDSTRNHDYDFYLHNCQDFAHYLLLKCGIRPVWYRQTDFL